MRVHCRQVGQHNLAAQNNGAEGNDNRTIGLVSWLSELHLTCWSDVRITEGTAACTWGMGVSLGGKDRIREQNDQTA